MNEQTLVRLAREGDKEALRMLFDQNKDKIFALAYNYTKNSQDAEDILQETFIKAFRSLPKFNLQNGTSFSPWLYRIGINCSLDHLRRIKTKKSKQANIENLENISSGETNSDPAVIRQKSELREKIDHTLKTLSGQQRMVFVLKHYQQLTIREIADHLNISEGGVKKQLFRAVHSLKESLKGLISENNYEMQKL